MGCDELPDRKGVEGRILCEEQIMEGDTEDNWCCDPFGHLKSVKDSLDLRLLESSEDLLSDITETREEVVEYDAMTDLYELSIQWSRRNWTLPQNKRPQNATEEDCVFETCTSIVGIKYLPTGGMWVVKRSGNSRDLVLTIESGRIRGSIEGGIQKVIEQLEMEIADVHRESSIPIKVRREGSDAQFEYLKSQPIQAYLPTPLKYLKGEPLEFSLLQQVRRQAEDTTAGRQKATEHDAINEELMNASTS